MVVVGMVRARSREKGRIELAVAPNREGGGEVPQPNAHTGMCWFRSVVVSAWPSTSFQSSSSGTAEAASSAPAAEASRPRTAPGTFDARHRSRSPVRGQKISLCGASLARLPVAVSAIANSTRGAIFLFRGASFERRRHADDQRDVASRLTGVSELLLKHHFYSQN